MCVGQYSYLRVVVCCGDYILHLGENIVYTFFGCCTYYYNLPSLVQREVAFSQENDGGIVKKAKFLVKNNPSVALRQLPLHKGAF